MRAYLVYTTTPDLKPLAMAWQRERAEDALLTGKTREQARREMAAADSDGNLKPPVGKYDNAAIIEVELPTPPTG